MQPLNKLFWEHPTSVGESYAQHLESACGFGVRMCIAGVACIIHGVFPFLFVNTASQQVAGLHDRMLVNRHRLEEEARKTR